MTSPSEGRKAPRPVGVDITRTNSIQVRLNKREEKSANDIALRKNRLFRKHQRTMLPIGDTIVALAFAKAQEDLFSFIAKHLYDKRVWDHPDDHLWRWNARRAWQRGEKIAFSTGGTILEQKHLPVVLGALNLSQVLFSVYLPGDWFPKDFESYKNMLLVPTSHLEPIGELTRALHH